MRSERLGGDVPEKSGPEKFAPPDRRPPERLGEIREFVRRDVAFLRRQRDDGGGGGDGGVSDNLNSLIRRVSGASMEEIDRVILELQGVRDMLRSEGERVSREIAGYASLSHAAMTAMKVIGDSLKQWKDGPNDQSEPSRRPANDRSL
jgi:hypothetical protein